MASRTPQPASPRLHPPSRTGSGMDSGASQPERSPGIAWSPQPGGPHRDNSPGGPGPPPSQGAQFRRDIGFNHPYQKFADNPDCFGGGFRGLYLFEIWSSPERDECRIKSTDFDSEEAALAHLRRDATAGGGGGGGGGAGGSHESLALSSSYRQTRILFLPTRVNSTQGFFPLGVSMRAYEELSALLSVPRLFLECLYFQEPVECLASVRGSQGYVLQTQDNAGLRRSLSIMPDPGMPHRTNILAVGFDDAAVHDLSLELTAMDLTTWSIHTLAMLVLWKAIQLGMERRQVFTSRQGVLQRALGVDDSTILSRNPMTAIDAPSERALSSQQLGNLSFYLTALADEWSWLHREILAEIRALEFIQDFIATSRAGDELTSSSTPRDGSSTRLSGGGVGLTSLGSGAGRPVSTSYNQRRRTTAPGAIRHATTAAPSAQPSSSSSSFQRAGTGGGGDSGGGGTGGSYDKADDLVLDRARMLASLLYGSSDYCTSFERGEETFRQTIYSLIAQRDSGYMQQLADTTAKDSGAMVIVSNVTAVFLPATFVATFFSTTFFEFQAGMDDVDKKIVSKWLWLYPVVTLGLTAIIFTWWKLSIRKREANLDVLKITRRAITQESHAPSTLNPLDRGRGTGLRSLNLPWKRASRNGGLKGQEDYELGIFQREK